MTELTKKKHKKGYFTSVLVDADGSGDAIVPLNDELMDSLGWHEGDQVELSVEGSKIIVRKKAE